MKARRMKKKIFGAAAKSSGDSLQKKDMIIRCIETVVFLSVALIMIYEIS